MAISRTPKKLDTADQMFSDPVAEVFADVDNEHNGGVAADDKYEKLAEQIAELQRLNEETRRENMALLSTPRNVSQVGFVETKVDSVPLPDPALDPDGYDAAVGKRQEIRSQNADRKRDFDRTRQQEINDKVDGLWEAFGDRYADMAEDKERIDFVSTAVVKAAQKRGVDIERYMFVTQDKFLSDVAKKYVEVFGEPDSNDADDFDDAPRSRRASSRDTSRSRTRSRSRQEDDEGRSTGIFGGNESGGRASQRRDRDDDENGPNMIDDIQALQKKTGFF